MKFGTYYQYWEQDYVADYTKYCRKVAELGFDVLEVAASGLLNMTDDQLDELAKTAKELNIELTASLGLPAEYNVASSDETVRQRGIEFMKAIIRALHRIGAKKIGGIIYSCWPVDYSKPVTKEKDLEVSIKSIRELADYALEHGVTLMIEVVNRFEQYLINDAAEGIAYVKAVGKENVKVELDTFHMNIEEDFLGDAIRNTGDYLGHLHVGECNRKVPGKGHMPWAEIATALKDIGYDGCVVMEPFVRTGGPVGSDIKVFRDLSDNADEAKLDKDIKESLIFLKDVISNA